jgi:hypothetical protein
MVPLNKPAEALLMINTFLRGEQLPTHRWSMPRWDSANPIFRHTVVWIWLVIICGCLKIESSHKIEPIYVIVNNWNQCLLQNLLHCTMHTHVSQHYSRWTGWSIIVFWNWTTTFFNLST